MEAEGSFGDVRGDSKLEGGGPGGASYESTVM